MATVKVRWPRAARGACALLAGLWLAAVVPAASAVASPPPGEAAALAHGEGAPESGASSAPDWVVRVNGTPISAAEVDRDVQTRIPDMTGHGGISLERTQHHQLQVIRDLVVRRLVLQAATDAGIEVNEEEVDALESTVRARFASQGDYERKMAEQGLSVEQVRTGLREHLMGLKMTARINTTVEPPTREQLHAYFEQHPEKFTIPPRARIEYLQIRVDPSSPEQTWQAAHQRMTGLRDRIQAGEGFADVAEQAAEAPEIEWVKVGLVHMGQSSDREVDRVAFTVPAGDVAEPVRTLFGYALVYVIERLDARALAFDELNLEMFREEWLSARRDEAQSAWVRELWEAADIEYPE